ncbi:unnamed protein product [Nezara viridula]|uniref:Uncharacterized protein n=1 Tax=Nezara viridula TaxID=85310 RepID=A0A9P0HUR5_NEZVI|nr:unnamed protein product [Nezara viridula]
MNEQQSEIDQPISIANRVFFSVSRVLKSRRVARNLKLSVRSVERFERIILSTIRRRKTYKEQRTETGQAISHNIKAMRLRWAEHISRSNLSGSLYTVKNASKVDGDHVEGQKPRWMIESTKTQ